MADADGIKHCTLKVNGIEMHVAEKGSGPVVLFVHGFPELWYSWRHQIQALSALGYRCVAPDMRGYGGTDAPADYSEYTYFHIVGDLVALMDALGVDKVFLVGHDWGAVVAWFMCLLRPDRITALVNTSVAFGALGKRTSDVPPVDALRALYGDDYYMWRFQAPGVMEAELADVGGAEKLLENFYPFRTPGPWLLPKGKWFNDLPPRPTWMTEEEFNYYATTFRKTGLTGGFNYYRVMKLNWEMIGPWSGSKIMVPTKFIVGDLDLAFHLPGAQDYILNGGMKEDVPLLKEVVVLKGVAHFLQQEKPDEINKHIYDFIQQFKN